MTDFTVFRGTMLAATSTAAIAFALPVYAADDPISIEHSAAPAIMFVDSASQGAATIDVSVEDEPGIVVREGFTTNQTPPAGILDPTNITGIGQMIVWNGNGSVGTCTGSLVNPRMVIFAAHCVNTRDAAAYGTSPSSTRIGFGFQRNNLPSIIDWINSGFQTSAANSFYSVEHLWYDPRSINPAGNFLQADIAIATLDRPAFDIPTWALLFSPLDQQEHVTVSGYGNTGVGTQGSVLSSGFRRRVAENYVSLLGSLEDRNIFLFGSASGGLPQNLYMSTLTDPNPAYNPAGGKFDFGLFGADDVALPVEGSTGGGDSGGPLIVDQKYAIPVVAGVLSGGSRFFGAQPFGSYGTHSFYQPLSAFWDVIVANNPYVYAKNKAGNGEWTDPSHWIQAMDPAYMIDVNGQLINGVPDAPGIGIARGGAKFGDICFLTTCATPASNPVTGNGTPYFVAGGPGSENFVPNNITGNPGLGIRPRYFDVTLSAAGTTRLSNASVTVDRLTINGATKLDIADSGSLTSLGDFTQVSGWTNVDGTINTAEAFILTGLLSGSGTFRAPFVTTVGAIIAPGGGDKVGTLTIDGNLIMASASALYIDASRNGADKLAVTGLLSLSEAGQASGTGASLVFNKTTDSPAPRHGQSFVIATAGSIEGQFGRIFSFQGVLRPELTYTATTVTAELRAGSLVQIIGANSPATIAFASALDRLREGSYNSLYNFYGMIDLMDGRTLSATLNGLAPQVNGEAQRLRQRQSETLFGTVTDRLSIIGNGGSGTLSVVGSLHGLVDGDTSHDGTMARSGLAGLSPDRHRDLALSEGFSGFVSGGLVSSESGLGASALQSDGQQTRYFSMGLERQIADGAAIGLAFGQASGISSLGSENARSQMVQIATYGSYQMNGGAYVGLAANYETASTETARSGFDGLSSFELNGGNKSARVAAVAETGINLGLTNGLTLTPRVQLGYNYTSVSALEEFGGETALQIDQFEAQQVEARFGAKLSGSQDIGDGWTIVPQMQADYVRLLDGGNDGLVVRFSAADDVAIVLPLAGGDTGWAEVQGGLKLTNGRVQFGAGFETSIGRQALRTDRAMADLTVQF